MSKIDTYCITREDGECVSDDPRCMHNKPMSKIEPVAWIHRNANLRATVLNTVSEEAYGSNWTHEPVFTESAMQQAVAEATEELGKRNRELLENANWWAQEVKAEQRLSFRSQVHTLQDQLTAKDAEIAELKNALATRDNQTQFDAAAALQEDYSICKHSLERLKVDQAALRAENERLQQELNVMCSLQREKLDELRSALSVAREALHRVAHCTSASEAGLVVDEALAKIGEPVPDQYNHTVPCNDLVTIEKTGVTIKPSSNGKGVPEYQEFGSKALRRVVCAAVWCGENGMIVCSPRHFDPLAHAVLRQLGTVGSWEQGFVDQRGVFMTREVAWAVAKEAGQILRRCGGDGAKLFSENLY